MSRELIASADLWKMESHILSIVGPTASGKTSLSLELAQEAYQKTAKQALLVSVDSVAVYRELNIGSAKPVGEARSLFDWCGLDLVNCSERLSAADFLRAVSPAIQKALEVNRPVIFVGGSLFYERMLVEGPGPGQASDQEFLKSLELESIETLYRRLCDREPRLSAIFSSRDRYRVLRYSDLIFRQGLSFEDLQKSSPPFRVPVQTLALGLERPRDPEHFLHRIREMLQTGWIEEVEALLLRYPEDAFGLKTVGYEQVVEYLRGKCSLAECESHIARAHARLAKKQRTWLRGLMRKTQPAG